MAQSYASDEHVDVANQLAFTAQDGLESTELFRGGFINTQHLRSRRGEKRTHPCDIGLHPSRVIDPKIELPHRWDGNRQSCDPHLRHPRFDTRVPVEEIDAYIRIQEIVPCVVHSVSSGRRVVPRWETVRAA
jgi:hypothetical protein